MGKMPLAVFIRAALALSIVASQLDKPNLLFIVADQYRFDALRCVQDQLVHFEDATKIETPNLDKLAAEGVLFMNAYTQLPSCAPARTTLFTGCTIERSGVQANNLISDIYAGRMPELFASKIGKLASFEQLLVEERGYKAERTDKWHLPNNLFYRRDGNELVIEHNDYDFVHEEPSFNDNLGVFVAYTDWLAFMTESGEFQHPGFGPGQLNGLGQWPFTPVKLDDRYGELPFESVMNLEGTIGWSELLENQTQTFYEYLKPRMALRRLATQPEPFSLVVNFLAPHPPMLASTTYASYYKSRQDLMFVPPSNQGEPDDSAYSDPYVGRQGSAFANKVKKVQEWMAVYYSLAQEIDDAVGALLEELEMLSLKDKTLVVFTSDHGEMLGAHGFSGKAKLFEEAAHVPLLMSFPGVIPANLTVNTPVSHLDVFSTVLDYMNAPYLDQSDGRSLRPRIEGKLYNKRGYEDVVISELDQRLPLNNVRLSGTLGTEPNFMIRHRDFKLMIPKLASSPVPDMLFDLSSDPFEMRNLLGKNTKASSIGKAEELKILLLDWLKDKDGPDHLYSLPEWNGGKGRGDIAEVQMRRTWNESRFWYSDRQLGLGQPLWLENGEYIRREYLYIGRTAPGKLSVKISIKGKDSDRFSWRPKKARLKQGNHVRVMVQYRSTKKIGLATLDAKIKLRAIGVGTKYIPIVESPY